MKMTSHKLRRWVTWTMVAVLFISLAAWYATRERLPAVLRLATGAEGGQYHEFGLLLKQTLEARTDTRVELITTDGTLENLQLLRDGAADFIIAQGGAFDLQGLGVVAPLYPDVMHIVVRNDRGIVQLADLADRKVILGSAGSGMRQSALSLLDHYGLNGRVQETDASYFSSLPGDASVDGAIITSGILNRDLRRILRSGQYQLLGIPDAAAIEMADPYFSIFVIPRGLYREQPPVPAEPVPTLRTTAFLVGHREAPEALVAEMLASVYEEGMRLQMPTLHTRLQAREWLDMPMHTAARRYFDPQDEIGHMAAIMESLAATKELLFALAAGIYLLWERWRRLREKEEQAVVREQKNHLDELLSRTVEIEARQIGLTDEFVLRQMLDDVTRIKLQALEELTHEELRGDRSFLIFLTQCSSLISKIQAKIGTREARKDKVTYLAALGLAAGAIACLLKNDHGGPETPDGPDPG